ncbi:hypothetical protein M408DRAFT_30235 [Serendipita vermifera MAFF 305830]|uniref:Uncharacterized protein n=1 Tax=Serendipita vermifera MAFF 305830 TaxID=933852 RepID=A0A0C2W253_SERVB|nr:hypothetical protein M408DRAFT_30235 [Serendipita vermifera MAFF 305830]
MSQDVVFVSIASPTNHRPTTGSQLVVIYDPDASTARPVTSASSKGRNKVRMDSLLHLVRLHLDSGCTRRQRQGHSFLKMKHR